MWRALRSVRGARCVHEQYLHINYSYNNYFLVVIFHDASFHTLFVTNEKSAFFQAKMMMVTPKICFCSPPTSSAVPRFGFGIRSDTQSSTMTSFAEAAFVNAAAAVKDYSVEPRVGKCDQISCIIALLFFLPSTSHSFFLSFICRVSYHFWRKWSTSNP